MNRVLVSCAVAAVLLLACVPLAAAHVTVAIDGGAVDVAIDDASPAEALATLAARAGFTVEGEGALPSTAMTLHLVGTLDRVVATLADATNHVATYDAMGHLIRLVLLSKDGTPAAAAVRDALPHPSDLAEDDPAVGGSRIGADRLRRGIHATLGLALP